MSNFDPSSPSYVPPGGSVLTDGNSFNYEEGNQTAVSLLASSSLSAGTAVVGISNLGCRGAIFLVNVTAIPGSASTTIALKLRASDPNSANKFVFAARGPISATGLAGFMVYPGISASAAGVSSVLPRTFDALLSLSTGATSKEVVLSMSMMRIR